VVSEKKKMNRVISFLKKGLVGLTDELEDTVKNIRGFIESLNKAEKDLKEVEITEEVKTVSTSSTHVVAPQTNVKTAAASTLFSLLSGSPQTGSAPPIIASPATAPPAPPRAPSSGPPRAPPGGGPPRAPPSSGPPRAPPGGGGPPRASNLPPAPRLPSAPPGGGGPPRAPPGGGGPPPMSPQAPIAPKPGGGLSSLRDEMLEELNRLKKIMRGE